MDGTFIMKTRDKILISLTIGLIATSLYSFPMWWGVLFSPITQQLTTEPVTEALTKGICFQSEDLIFRFKGLDLLMDFFSRF